MRFRRVASVGEIFSWRMATFPTTKRHLSTLHPCPFEAPSLTFRISIPKPPQPETCPTPAPPLAYGLSTRPHFASAPPKTVPSRPLFHPKFQPHISTKDFYPPPSGPTARMIMRNVMGLVRNGHAQYSATRNGMKRRAADGKLRQTDGQA